MPAAPGATKPTFEVPSPSSTLCVVNVDKPVPPLGTKTGVDNEIVVDHPGEMHPPPVKPAPAVIVNCLMRQLLKRPLKLVALNEATTFLR